MKALLIQLDEPTLKALNRIVGRGKRQQSEFIRDALREAIREAEYRVMREAYTKQPDSFARRG